jgi:hypothetical protein
MQSRNEKAPAGMGTPAGAKTYDDEKKKSAVDEAAGTLQKASTTTGLQIADASSTSGPTRCIPTGLADRRCARTTKEGLEGLAVLTKGLAMLAIANISILRAIASPFLKGPVDGEEIQ